MWWEPGRLVWARARGHTCSWIVGSNVVGRDGSWGDLGIGIAVEDERGRVHVVVITVVDENVVGVVVVGQWWKPPWTKADIGHSPGRWWRRLRDVVIVAVVEAVVDEGARISFGMKC